MVAVKKFCTQRCFFKAHKSVWFHALCVNAKNVDLHGMACNMLKNALLALAL